MSQLQQMIDNTKTVLTWGLWTQPFKVTFNKRIKESVDRNPAMILDGIKYINIKKHRVRLTFWSKEDCLKALKLTGWTYTEDKPTLIETYRQGEFLICNEQKILFDNALCFRARSLGMKY